MKSGVHIIGPNQLQNALMASFIQNETGIACSSSQDLDPEFMIAGNSRCLILWDNHNKDLENLWNQLEPQSDSAGKQALFGLFNARCDQESYRIHKEAVIRGIRGIFFENDPPCLISKGVQAILKGECWLSRSFMSRYVTETRAAVYTRQATHTGLTRREKEILAMAASEAIILADN